MREIKFRVWCRNRNEWEKDVCFIGLDGDVYQQCFASPVMLPVNKKKHIIMQYTGLKDKNGVEIYFDDALTNGEMTRRVIWREDDSQIQLSVNDDNHDNRIKLTQQLIETFGLTICGNIYENPELLEIKKTDSPASKNQS